MEYPIVLVRKSRHEKENLDLMEKSQPLLYIMAFHNSKSQNQNARRSATRNNIQTIQPSFNVPEQVLSCAKPAQTVTHKCQLIVSTCNSGLSPFVTQPSQDDASSFEQRIRGLNTLQRYGNKYTILELQEPEG